MIFSSNPASPVDFGQVSLTRTRRRVIDILITTGVGEGGTYTVEVVSSDPQFAAEDVNGSGTNSAAGIVFPDAAAVPAIPATIAFVAPAFPGAVAATLTVNVRNAANAIVDSGTISVNGDAIATALVMVLDRSGSMSTMVGTDTRANRLRAAASSCLALMLDHEKLGVVTFDHIVTDVLGLSSLDTPSVTMLGTPYATQRAAAEALFDTSPTHAALDPAGATSIGGGIVNGQAMVAAEANQNILVLTDGHQNYPPAIPAIASEDIYAIGLGDASAVSTVALDQLTAGTGNYLLITGDIATQQFALDKYFIDVLTDVKNYEIIVDPDGTLQPGKKQEIGFPVTKSDQGFDAILLSDNPALVDFELIQPDKKVIHPADANQIPGGSFTRTSRVSFFRFDKPMLTGQWRARLSMDKRVYALDKKPGPIRYSFLVIAQSDIELTVGAHAKGLHVGSDLLLSASVTEFGRPVGAKVVAQISLPDKSVLKLDLQQTQPARFSAVFPTFAPGHYQVHFFASGKGKCGTPFTREARRSLFVAPAGFVPVEYGPIPKAEIPPGGLPDPGTQPGGTGTGGVGTGGTRPGGYGTPGGSRPGSLDDLFARFPDLKKLLERCCGNDHHGHGHCHGCHADCCCSCHRR